MDTPPVYCIVYENKCSPLAKACPACGHPLRATVAEVSRGAEAVARLPVGHLPPALRRAFYLMVAAVIFGAMAANVNREFGFFVMMVSLLPLGVAIVFAPPIVAYHSNHPQRALILLGTLVIGGTGIGWIAMLVWAYMPPKQASQ